MGFVWRRLSSPSSGPLRFGIDLRTCDEVSTEVGLIFVVSLFHCRVYVSILRLCVFIFFVIFSADARMAKMVG